MTTQYKWLPSEPTDEMITSGMTIDSVHFNIDIDRAMLIKVYKVMWQAASEIEQEPIGEIEYDYTNRGYVSYANLWDDLPVKTLLYTHPQADQTLLINQLTEELNKTEAARVKWMTMALTSQPKRATKDHEIAKFVSELTAIANEYQGTQQLRNRLRGVVLSFVEKYKREPLNEIELKQIFEQSIGLKYWDFAKAIEKAHGIGV